MKTDIQIAQEAQMAHIKDVAATVGIEEEELEFYGKYKAKLSDDVWEKVKDRPNGKLVLVTAINPTPAGEGKTTTTVGLGQALAKLDKKAIIALREPSLGPCFGIKLSLIHIYYEHITYEGYGPNGTAIIVEALTDNKNRTASNVKNAFTKGNGNVGTPGCVSFMFDKKGQIVVDKEEYEGDSDELMMLALDAGAEDFVEEEDSCLLYTSRCV